MGDSLENPDASVDLQSVPIVEFGTFTDYLKNVTAVLLPEEDGNVSPALASAIEDKTNQECIRKFLADPQVQSLFLQRSSTKGLLVITVFFSLLLMVVRDGASAWAVSAMTAAIHTSNGVDESSFLPNRCAVSTVSVQLDKRNHALYLNLYNFLPVR